MPQTPEKLSEVKWAAGISPGFVHRETLEQAGPFRILFERSDDADTWVGVCLEHYFSVETDPGDSLDQAHRMVIENLLGYLEAGELANLPAAPQEEINLWDKIFHLVGRNCSEFGDVAATKKLLRSGNRHKIKNVTHFSIVEQNNGDELKAATSAQAA